MDIMQLQTGGTDNENVITNPAFLCLENSSQTMHSKRQSMKSYFRGRNSMLSNKHTEGTGTGTGTRNRMNTLLNPHQPGLSVDSGLLQPSDLNADAYDQTYNEESDSSAGPQNRRLSMLLMSRQEHIDIDPVSIPISPKSIINEENWRIADDSENQSKSIKRNGNSGAVSLLNKSSSSKNTKNHVDSKNTGSSNKVVARLLVQTKQSGTFSKNKRQKS